MMPFQKFNFDNDFGGAQTPDDVQTITPREFKERMAQVHQSAFKEGYQKGVVDTNANIARVAGDQMFVITTKIEDLIAQEARLIDTLHQEVAGLSQLMLKTLFPTISERFSTEILENILTKALDDVPRTHTCTLRVHQDLKDYITTFVQDHFKEHKEEGFTIQVEGYPYPNHTDCEILFEGGGIEYYGEKVAQRLDHYLESLSPTLFKLPERQELDQENNGTQEDLADALVKETPEDAKTPSSMSNDSPDQQKIKEDISKEEAPIHTQEEKF